ncbi:hypothetical protein IAQ61_004843 [Plenodomus lingam]|uniref:uncharacterized protein n=1 Tax=Leptosphaeria maculans TaxID=5022 RepID=UPI003319C2F3|nr:hypothetical protein IAQ61_004843 [Plenodomus lingam]
MSPIVILDTLLLATRTECIPYEMPMVFESRAPFRFRQGPTKGVSPLQRVPSCLLVHRSCSSIVGLEDGN